jgi:hypothetical protein
MRPAAFFLDANVPNVENTGIPRAAITANNFLLTLPRGYISMSIAHLEKTNAPHVLVRSSSGHACSASN